jgi:hypothetical protein
MTFDLPACFICFEWPLPWLLATISLHACSLMSVGVVTKAVLFGISLNGSFWRQRFAFDLPAVPWRQEPTVRLIAAFD